MYGLFLSKRQAKMLGHDIILHTVRKLTRKIKESVRERVLPWYKGRRIEKD